MGSAKMHDDAELIRVCPRHADYRVAMVLTLAFTGAEKWCPFCGWTTGTLFSDRSTEVPPTAEIVHRLEVYAAASIEFLRARGQGDWEYGVRAEELPQIELPDGPRPDFVCDGCGRRGTGFLHHGKWAKPPHWYSREDENGVQLACSRECVKAVAALTGAPSMVLPW